MSSSSNRHHILGLAAPADPDRQAEAAALVDHVQELEAAPISGGMELEVHATADEDARLGDDAPSRRQAWPASACRELTAGALPLTRAAAPTFGSPTSPPETPSDKPYASASGYSQKGSLVDAAEAWPPQGRLPCPNGAVCCGAGPRHGGRNAQKPGTGDAVPPELCDVVPAQKFPSAG